MSHLNFMLLFSGTFVSMFKFLLFQMVFNYELFSFFFFFNSSGLSSATISVSLQVDPPSVSRGQSATFICTYDLQGAPLYSVKFYRGVLEFYRFSPNEVPTNKVFPFPGFNVDVSIHY